MRTRLSRWSPLIAAGLVYASASSLAAAQTIVPDSAGGLGLCGPLENSFGPFDYRTATKEQKSIVERYRFTPAVETLRSGSTGSIGSDLDYTLRAFPNHLRALSALSRYSQRVGQTRIPGAHYPVECYFDRAIRFTPDDPQVRVLYGFYLMKQKRVKEARTQLSAAEGAGHDDPQVAYNLGLAYLELGDYDRSVIFAKKAYAGGISFPGLRNRLTAAGKWK